MNLKAGQHDLPSRDSGQRRESYLGSSSQSTSAEVLNFGSSGLRNLEAEIIHGHLIPYYQLRDWILQESQAKALPAKPLLDVCEPTILAKFFEILDSFAESPISFN